MMEGGGAALVVVLVEVPLPADDGKLAISHSGPLVSSVCTATGALRVRSIERTVVPPPAAMFDEEEEDDEDDGATGPVAAAVAERCFGIGIFMAARSSALSSRNENGAQRLLRARTGLPPVACTATAADDGATASEEHEDDERLELCVAVGHSNRSSLSCFLVSLGTGESFALLPPPTEVTMCCSSLLQKLCPLPAATSVPLSAPTGDRCSSAASNGASLLLIISNELSIEPWLVPSVGDAGGTGLTLNPIFTFVALGFTTLQSVSETVIAAGGADESSGAGGGGGGCGGGVGGPAGCSSTSSMVDGRRASASSSRIR